MAEIEIKHRLEIGIVFEAGEIGNAGKVMAICKQAIAKALIEYAGGGQRGSIGKAAGMIGMSRAQFWRWLNAKE